jgi:hypothetical protein
MPPCVGGPVGAAGRLTTGRAGAWASAARRRAPLSARAVYGAGIAVAAVALAGGCVTGCARTASMPVLDAIAHPQRLAQPVSLAQVNGAQAGCQPPAAPAADHGLCNVVGPVLTITGVRAAWAAGGQDGYFVFLRVPTSQQAALAAFMKRVDNHEIAIVVGDTLQSSMLIVGPQPGGTVTLPAGETRARAERLFQRLTGAA